MDKSVDHAWGATLGRGAWFASLPVAWQVWLLAQARERPLAAGQRLFARGDAPDGLYAVAAGAVRVSGLNESGQESLLAVLAPPQWFGEIALFDGAPRTHDAWAERPSTLLHVPQAVLLAKLAAEPVGWWHLGQLLAQRLRLLMAGLEDLVLQPPTVRVAHRLAQMAGGYGAWADRSQRMLEVSQAQLGLMLALSRQTVNTSLRSLEAAGAIRRHRGTIEVLDLAALVQQQG